MESIKKIFKIGYGPSSSHTMAPAKAAELFKSYLESDCEYLIDAIFYNSLNKTGNGHLTYTVVSDIFKPYKVNIIRKLDKRLHPNFFSFLARNLKTNEKIEKSFESIGGGDFLIVGESYKENKIYPDNNFSSIKKRCLDENLTLYEYVYKYDDKNIKD